MANHGPVYGLSREIQIKNQARFNLLEAQEVLDWIQECTRMPFDVDPFAMSCETEVTEVLKDGVQLCILAERILGPGKVRYIKNPKQPFHMMENISTFLNAIKQYGVPEISCFQTVDLYEKKQSYKVFECLRALADYKRGETSIKRDPTTRVPVRDYQVIQQEGKFFDDVVVIWLRIGDTTLKLVMVPSISDHPRVANPSLNDRIAIFPSSILFQLDWDTLRWIMFHEIFVKNPAPRGLLPTICFMRKTKQNFPHNWAILFCRAYKKE